MKTWFHFRFQGGLFILVYKVLGLRMAFLVVALLYVLGVAMVLLYPTTRSPRSAQKQSDSNSYSATFIDAFRVPSTWWMALYMLIYKSGLLIRHFNRHISSFFFDMSWNRPSTASLLSYVNFYDSL